MLTTMTSIVQRNEKKEAQKINYWINEMKEEKKKEKNHNLKARSMKYCWYWSAIMVTFPDEKLCAHIIIMSMWW